MISDALKSRMKILDHPVDPKFYNNQEYFRHSNAKRDELVLLRSRYWKNFWPFIWYRLYGSNYILDRMVHAAWTMSAFVLSLKPSLFTEFMSIPSSSHFLLLCSIISRAVFPRLFFVSILAPKRSKFLLASSLLTSNKFGSSSQFDDSSQWRTESNWKW